MERENVTLCGDMMIDWNKSADLNKCSVDELKARFERFPSSNKKIIAICEGENCLQRERIIYYGSYRKLCHKCASESKKTFQLTQQGIKELFDYRDDGVLIWKETTQYHKSGDVGGTVNKKTGYREITINGDGYYIHRLIFIYHHGYLSKEIDHIDGIRDNNRIENIRAVNRSENQMNAISKGGSSQYKGVNWHKASKKWQAQIQVNGKRKYLGLFILESEAARIYNKVAEKVHGKYARLNIIEDDI